MTPDELFKLEARMIQEGPTNRTMYDFYCAATVLFAAARERDELRKERDSWKETAQYLDGVIEKKNGRICELLEQSIALRALLETLERVLKWYSETVGDCRKITTEGDRARQALDRDHGDKANAALAQIACITTKRTTI